MELAGLAGTIFSRCMLDVTRQRVLVAVARCGSVTAAARALNYAQPSVSHHLARLEAETGTKLMLRAGYVDVALVFRYSEERSGSADGSGPGFMPGLGPGEDEDNGIDLAEGLRERLLLTEPVHLVTSAHGAAAGPAAGSGQGEAD